MGQVSWKVGSMDHLTKSAWACGRSALTLAPPFYSFLFVSREAEWPPCVYFRSELGICPQDSLPYLFNIARMMMMKATRTMIDVTLMNSL